jgi:hypothetical protein
MSKRDGARVKGMMMGVGTQRKEKSKYGEQPGSTQLTVFLYKRVHKNC